jgi:hypothetical protein
VVVVAAVVAVVAGMAVVVVVFHVPPAPARVNRSYPVSAKA